MKHLNVVSLITLALMITCVSMQAQDQSQYDSFGDLIDTEETLDYQSLISALEGRDSVTAKIMATVDEVCQMKGCWMNVSTADVETPIMVRFKDYGFFVPKDIAGKEVIMSGVAYKQMTSVEDLRHYAKDAGKSEDEIALITEPKEEITFMADGVLVKK